MTDFSFEPTHLDFELRAIALRDYRRVVGGGESSAEAPVSPRNQKFLWLLRELGNVAYVGFSTAAVMFDEEANKGTWKNNEERNSALDKKNLNSIYARVMFHANTILDKLSEPMKLDDAMTRREFLTNAQVAQVVAEVLDGEQGKTYPLRSSFASLNGAYGSGKDTSASVWARAINDDGDEPWWMPEMLVPEPAAEPVAVAQHRLRVLRTLHHMFSDPQNANLNNLLHDYERNEFGVRKISLLKVALWTVRQGTKENPQGRLIYPAEVATVVKRNLDKAGIPDRRVFVELLRRDLEELVGRLEDEELDRRFIVLGPTAETEADESGPIQVVEPAAEEAEAEVDEAGADDEEAEPEESETEVSETGEDSFTEPEEGETP